ncbi:MAG TPA: alpha-2-macroglobulin family protein [Pyrinomonadaceae bacterium]|nr:alpha-2-macroglobulin family protein [Pyrinomonadaceae bacterium]
MRNLVSWVLLFGMYLNVISPFVISANAQKTSGKTTTKTNMNVNLPEGLQFRLSEGEEGAETREKQTLAETKPLSQGDTDSLLKRIPEIKTDQDDQKDFNKRLGTLPAPKTGKTIPVKFPAPEQINPTNIDQAKIPLEVIRYSPEGEVPLAPDLNVTFSQPMVAVTSQEEAAKVVPVELTPQVEGKWRWLGTKTLMFDTTKRFPMATKFTARVPAGTKSATGQVLQKDVTWTFTTPPPKVETMIPKDQVTRRDALMFVSFDQEINPEAVLRAMKVTGGGKPLTVRLATQEEIAQDGSISYYAKQAQPRRWLAFRAVTNEGLTADALPADSAITVNIPKGTPSAEGPLTTLKDQSYSFRTYGAMKFAGGWCSYQGSKTCTPSDNWYMEFTNPIDGATFDKSMVKVEPPVEGLSIFPSGNYLYFQGYKKGRTVYKVTLDNKIKDIYGQLLDKPAAATFNVGSAQSNLYSQGGTFVILDPTAKPTYSIYSTNMPSVKVKVLAVTPQNWEEFRQYMRYSYYDEQKRPKIPGRLVVNKVLPIQTKADEMVETRIDLSEVLDGGFGNAIIEIEPTVKRDKYDRTKITVWAQSTNIGLDAFVDNEELVGFATDLKTGKPLSGVELSIYPNGKTPAGKTVSETEPNNKSWWEWLWSWGSSEEPNTEVQSVDENGATQETETIEAAQTNNTTDNGILRLPLPETQSQKAQNVLIARKGKDVAFMPENSDYYWNDYGNWYKKGYSDQLKWFVFDDRKMYRPKEEVSIKGYMRYYEGAKLGDIQPLGDRAGGGISYVVRDSRGNEITKGTANVNAFGAFDFKFKLTDNMNLGMANIQILTANNSWSTYHQFNVQEFRRPEFEVKAKVDSPSPHFVGGKADLSVEAKYFAGGGLANADANWTVTATATSYTPPNRGDFTFGTWIPWWRSFKGDDFEYGGGGYRPGGLTTTQTFKGVTDASGIHRLKIDFESVKPPRPYAITASSSVQDVNRQTWSSSTSLLVHPSDLYVGIKTPRTFVQKNEKILIESIVSDIDGNLVKDRDVEIKAVLKDWVFEKNAWIEKVIDEQTCSVKSLGDKAQKCEFIAKQGGQYKVTATVMDDKERFNESEFTVWVPGGKTPPKRNVEQEEAQIIPNKKDYAPNDVAEILVISPFPGAEGVLTLRRDGIIKTERFTMKDSSVTLKIPLPEKYLPNIYAQVDLVGAAERQNDKGEIDPKIAKRPAFASGNINLAISTDIRKLNVSAEPKDKTVEPGGATKIDVAVTDNRGEPVANSEVAVVVVDESVLALSGYRIGSPLDLFYSLRGDGVNDYHSRKDILLGNPLDVKNKSLENSFQVDGQEVADFKSGAVGGARPSPAPVMAQRSAMTKAKKESSKDDIVMAEKMTERDEDAPTNPEKPINLRSNFNALAIFAPSVKTDSNGKATVEVKVPDNLTRYRVMAVVVDAGKRFGGGESSLTARQPLMVRPSAPRFMNFGDRVELPVVVQNQTDKDMAVNVAVRATNATLTAGGGKSVLVKANDRAEVRFPVSAEKAGTARFQIAVTSGNWSDAAEISLPVWTPATTEAFATYGTTDQNGAIFQPVQTPGDVYPQFGGLEVTTSSTQLQELTDAFVYLYRYPYECSEQISSRMISIAALRDVLTAFKSKEMPTAAELQKSYEKDIEILKGRQRADGSFGLWSQRRERYEYPFLTVHVAHALALAKSKGYKVPDEMLDRTKPYLKNIETKFDEWHRKSPQVRWTISAYALYIRDLMGDKDVAKAKALLKEATLEKLPFEAIGWILSVLANDKTSVAEVEAIKRFLMNRTTETAATANFVTDYGDGGWLIMYSNRRADGVLLEALIKAEPTNDLIPKLVRGLLDHRTKGAWSNTQENVFILLALDKYFNAFEKVTPDFVTKIWLGGTYAGEEVFKGRSIDSNLLNIPMSYLVEQGGTSNLILDKQGAGRLYYRIGMKYAPKNLRLAPADYGFTVLRKYEAVDAADDVKQNADGSWTIKAGARVRIRLTMVAQARRYHVALVDNLPAGLEILNPELAVTEAVPSDTQTTSVTEYGSRSYGYGYYWWRQYWFEHQNFRDERAEAFASLLWEGVYNYSYVTRATTPGQFVVPPAKAEEMYHPETFGRTGTDFVNVE